MERLVLEEDFAGGRSVEGPQICMSVDLPEPLGPMIDRNSPAFEHAGRRRLQGIDLPPSLRVLFRDAAQFVHSLLPVAERRS